MTSTTSAPATLPRQRRGGRAETHALHFQFAHLQRRDFNRAGLVFEGVDHAGPSYEARIFLNNPTFGGAATSETNPDGFLKYDAVRLLTYD